MALLQILTPDQLAAAIFAAPVLIVAATFAIGRALVGDLS